MVTVGRPRPYSIIILNMRFIPNAALTASSQITATLYILERQVIIPPKPLALALSWELVCKQTDCITAVISKRANPRLN